MTTPRFMTQVEYGRHRGVGKSAVSNWKKAGLLAFGEDPADGLIKVDVVRSDAKLNAKLDPMRGRPSAASALPPPAESEEAPALPLGEARAAPDPPESLQSVRLDVLREDRVGKALKNAQSAGDLAAVAELELRASALGKAWLERTHAWYRGVAEQLAATRDVRTVITIGEDGIDAIFADLARAAAAGELAEDEPEDPELEAEAEAEMIAAIDAGEAG